MEEYLKRYPRKAAGNLVIRPMEPRDEAALVSFFKRIPVDERQRFREDVTNSATIKGWIKNLNYAAVLPILVLEGDRVVADATLHRDRAGWSRHTAKVRITLDPDFRRRGVARALIQEFVELARPLRIAILNAEILAMQQGAIKLFESLGFVCVATLPQQALDLTGKPHDLAIYSHTVIQPEKLAPEASLSEADADVGGG
jgi:L-amino acid N-acyltransferase YncA